MLVTPDLNTDAILVLLQNTRTNLDRIEALMLPSGVSQADEVLDPKSPLNKTGVNLSPRGIEVAYRMFDAGRTRYAVSEALDISYGAATHRYHSWEKAGGKTRTRQPL
jgi:hypothetical protein